MSVADFKSNSALNAPQPTKHWPQYLAGASAASGAFIFGMVLGKDLQMFLKILLRSNF